MQRMTAEKDDVFQDAYETWECAELKQKLVFLPTFLQMLSPSTA